MINNASYFIHIPIHPLLYITIAFAFGIWWQAAHYPLELAFALYLVGTALMLWTQKQNSVLSLALCSFFLAAVSYQKKENAFAAFYKKTGRKPFAITGTITGIENRSDQKFKQVLTIDLNTIKPKETTIKTPCIDCITVYLRTPTDLQEQDHVIVENLVASPPKNSSYKIYLLKQGIAANAFPARFNYTVTHRPTRNIKKAIRSLRTTIYEQCKKKLSPKTFALFSSLFLGNSSDRATLKELQKKFQCWGISHHFARSGLHLVIFIFLLTFFTNCLPISFLTQQLIIAITVILYALLSWTSISFIRALVTVLLYTLCNALTLPIDFLQLLTIVTLLVLVTSPHQLFCLDFQLSFGLTYALAWLNRVKQIARIASAPLQHTTST